VATTGASLADAPALAQADVGLAVNTGAVATRETANMLDLGGDPTKLIEVVTIAKQLRVARAGLTAFLMANSVPKGSPLFQRCS